MPDPPKMIREVIQEGFMHIICLNVHGGEWVACMMKPRSNLCAAHILNLLNSSILIKKKQNCDILWKGDRIRKVLYKNIAAESLL